MSTGGAQKVLHEKVCLYLHVYVHACMCSCLHACMCVCVLGCARQDMLAECSAGGE